MSLEFSQYTFHTLQAVDKAAFQKEVDRITKEVDHVEDSRPQPAKRGRFSTASEGAGPSAPPAVPRVVRQPHEMSGTILEVVLEDFLCHSHYKVTLNKQINFIVGRNGSGKSAILTGLVVALGGNASTTGRGAALKDFIKHGSPSARVTCVINNSGILSYKKEVYGEKIIVVRTLQSQGGSSIKLKSERGKQISSKMEDLRAMTLHLGIQVDNPISVLDQNTARHFLNQSKPSTKFELFMRATNLETLQRIYIEIALSVDKINQEIQKKERQLVENNAEVMEAQRKFDMFQKLEEDRAKGDILKMELLWAQVRDSMAKFQSLQKDLTKCHEEKVHLENLLSSEEQTEPILQEIESVKSQVQSLENDKKEAENEIKSLRQKFSTIVLMQKKLNQDKQSTEIRLKQDERCIQEYKAEIRSQEQKMLPEHVDNRRRQREEIHELQRVLTELRSNQKNKETEMRELQAQSHAINDSLDQVKRTKRRHEEDLRNLRNQLQGLEANTSNLSLFGPCMPDLVHQIESSHQFKKKPIGPLGAYVRVKDHKWALAVESVIRGRLNTFVVENIEDEKLLQSMIKRVFTRGQKPGVIRTKCSTTPYDTSRTSARTSEYCNVMDVMEVSNVVASNILIDQCRVESIMLVPTDDECFHLLSDVRSVPRNCLKAHTLNGDSYMPAPNYGTYASTQRNVCILQSSRDNIISDTKSKIRELEQNLNSLNERLNIESNQHAQICNAIKQARLSISNMSKQILDTESNLEKLKDVEQPDINSVSVLREELAMREKELEERRSQLEKFPEEMEVHEKQKQEIKNEGSEWGEKLKKITADLENLQRRLEQGQEQLEEIQSSKVGKKRRLEQVKKIEADLSKKSKDCEEEHVVAKGEAEKLEAHIRSSAAESGKEFRSMSKTKRNVKVIDQELRTLSKRLASVEKTLGQSAETTEKDFHEKLAAYNTTKNAIKNLKINASYLRHALDQRRSLYHTQKRLMCGVVSHQFTRVLRYRNCTGNVKVNFDRRTLDIFVNPVDEGEKAGLGTNSLSGGERSYATMAFVIALWNVTEVPFYYLDEFDVFMDMLNRQTVLSLLLKFAKQKGGYQFGFLTPLDTTAITASDSVSIFRLADPERNTGNRG